MYLSVKEAEQLFDGAICQWLTPGPNRRPSQQTSSGTSEASGEGTQGSRMVPIPMRPLERLLRSGVQLQQLLLNTATRERGGVRIDGSRGERGANH